MSRIAFTESWTKVNERGISRIEDRLKITFPPQFKKFLLRQNGGIPRPGRFTVNDKDYKIALFYSIGGGQDKDISYGQKNANLFLSTHFSEEQRKDYDGFLAIAEDTQSNIIFLGTDGDTEGHVYHFDKKAKAEPLTLLSNTFNEFLTLFPGSDGDLDSDLDDEEIQRDDDDEDYISSNIHVDKRQKRNRRRRRNYGDDDEDDDDD